MPVTIQLFYVPDKALIDFQIHAFESHDRILQNVRARFGVPFVAVYSQDAKRQPTNLSKVLEGAILLVTTSALEHPQPYSPVDFKLYRGEETGFVHPSMQGKPWAETSETERKSHIVSLGANRPETKNTLRITEPYAAITIELDALKKTLGMHTNDKYALKSSYDKIFRNWGLYFTMWLPEELKPKGSLAAYQWDLEMVASIAILAKATPGQGHILKEVLKNFVEAQGTFRVPVVQDVLQVIDYIYQRAGLINAKMTKTEKDKIKEKERQKARKARKKAANRSRAGEEDMDELDEDAAEAADPKGLWTKKDGDDVDDLADKLGGTQTSRPARRTYVEDTESD
ncbi:hypothetical protein HBI56_098500 [Parastagonospora nodorum]|nr:hypothetical protein HBI10_025550 [Parastagonospora nodorum]KAH4023004.1 hypothetical protein HBI13_093160 [Parastagonospora nodorum]KAH5167878.1 hypothetical protein HBI73_016250 [Parastagonospora nodorum]KAH5194671.1 hypothetical protein HBH76_057810 [Parastagonospora nodorum]KAH5388004.1 hypothetical protein HBI33_054380 [Parastagonospora nodorum]